MPPISLKATLIRIIWPVVSINLGRGTTTTNADTKAANTAGKVKLICGPKPVNVQRIQVQKKFLDLRLLFPFQHNVDHADED